MAKRIKHEDDESEVIEKGWSAVRILTALVIMIVFVGGIIWSFLYATRFVLQSTRHVLGAQTETSSQVRLPTDKDLKYLLSSAPEYVSTFIAQQGASSSAITQLMQELQNLQATDKGVEDIVCKYLCKDSPK